MEQGDTTAPNATPGAKPRRRRWPYVVGGIVVVLAAFVIIAPDYIARYVVKSELNKMGLIIEGAETFRIKTLQRQIWFGPVKVGVPDAPLAEVEQFGVEFRLLNLFRKQAVITRVLISGVDVQITKETDGRIFVNGIDVQKLAASEENEAPPPVEDSEDSGWGAGLDSFELSNSQVFFTDRQKGTVRLELDRLVVSDFRTWQPEEPGYFAIAALINDIVIRIEGTAKPFGETILADVRTDISAIEMPKIARFTGPLGFERRGGTVDVRLEHSIEMAPDGSMIDLSTHGQIEARELDVAMPDGTFLMALGKALVDIDVGYVGDPSTKGEAKGIVNVDLSNAAPIAFGPTEVSFDDATISLADIAMTVDAAGNVNGTLQPTVTVAGTGLTGPATVAVDKITLALSSLAVGLQDGNVNASTTGTTQVRAVTVDNPIRAQVEAIDIGLNEVSVAVRGAETRVAGGLSLDVQAAEASVDQEGGEPIQATLQSLALALASADLALAAESVSVKTNGTLALQSVAATVPKTAAQPPMEAGFDRLDITLSDAGADIAGESLTWQAAFELAMEALSASVSGGDAATATIAGIELSGMQVDHRPGVTGEAVLIRRPEARVTNDIFTAFGGKAEEQPESDQAMPPITIDRIAIVDGATIDFIDASTTPDIAINTQINTLEILDFTTADPAQPMELSLDALINQFTTVQALGTAAPFGAKPDFDITSEIKQFQMPAVSPYVAQAAGVNIQQGTLGVKADATAKAGQLDSRIGIEVQKLEFESLSQEQSQELSSGIGVPIETAVAIMEDSDNRINLDVEISGDVTSPEFNIGEIIGDAIVGAVKAAVAAPFNLLAKGGKALVGGGDGSGLPGVSFAAGEATLGPDAEVFASGLADVMKERPNFAIQVCGRVTAQDFQALGGDPRTDAARQQMQALAQERTKAIRQALIEGQGLAADRVGECRASADISDQGPPRAEVTF